VSAAHISRAAWILAKQHQGSIGAVLQQGQTVPGEVVVLHYVANLLVNVPIKYRDCQSVL